MLYRDKMKFVFLVAVFLLSIIVVKLGSTQDLPKNELLQDINSQINDHDASTIRTPIEKLYGEALEEAFSSKPCNGDYSGSGKLYIKAVRDTWLSTFLVDEFNIELSGDPQTNCYVTRQDNSGNGFFQTGFTSFYNLPSGKFSINLSVKDREAGVVSVAANVVHNGVDEMWCTVDVTNKYISCSYR